MTTQPLWTRRRFLLSAAAAAGGTLAWPPRLRAFGAALPPLAVLRVGLVAPEGAPFASTAAAGVRLGVEEAARTAALFGRGVELVHPAASGSDPVATAHGLADGGADVLLSALPADATGAVAAVADERRIPLLNLTSAADDLRGADCRRFLFHVAPSTAMRTDAAVRWLAGTRKPAGVFVVVDSDAGRAKTAERVESGLRTQGATVSGRATVSAAGDVATAISTAASSGADAVVVVADRTTAGAFVGGWSRPGTLVVDLSDAADGGDSHAAGTEVVRPLGWHSSLDRFGADQLNQRFERRYGRKMDDAAWAGWAALKVAWEAAMRGNAGDGAAIAAYLESERAEMDGQKGWPLSFRPWDHQLRQPLYLVSTAGGTGGRVAGEVPGGERGGGDSAAALDALGVGRAGSACRWGAR
jgi:ABC-type branched-subunit amino acid transport system substrate-binding protein